MKLHPLDLKLLRDLGRMKGQSVAVALVMACGLAMMIMARSLTYSLESTRDAYYSDYAFADVFADLKRAPNALRARIAEIEGVAAVETRVTGKVTLDLPDMQEPADGTILSLPDDRPQVLNQLFLRKGRLPEIGQRAEVVVGEAFAKAHGFGPGDRIAAILRGQRQELTICGVALSPEYVFESRPGETLPDNKRFGVFWMNERALATALDLDGAFNNVLVDVAPGADIRAVISSMDSLLERYGGLGAYGRRDHPSALRLDDELRVLRGLAVAYPVVFLSIAAFMTSAVLTRLVRLQREQIAQLKAFGYSSRQVGVHYFKFALVIVAMGTAIGAVAGFWLGSEIVALYHKFFQFPSLTFHPDWNAILLAFAVSAVTSFVGVFGAVRQAMKLPPAEAMRPEPPADFKPSVLERAGLSQLVSTTFRMALRNIERRPWQAAFTALGLALATGIPVVPGCMREGIDYLMRFQWDKAQRQDATLSFIEPNGATAFDAVLRIPGVTNAEPFRTVPARLRFGHRSRRLAITGLPSNGTLSRAFDGNGNPLSLPLDGLLVSAKLAELLGAKPGDTLSIEVQEGERPVRDAVLRGLITDYAGVFAYMDIAELRRWMREGDTVSGAYVSIDRAKEQRFFERVKETPQIASLAITDAARASFKKTTAESINLIQGLYFFFAVVVAFGVVYNSARIALSERSRDLATLRVVGFTNREVTGLLVSELVMLTLVALPIGLLLGSSLSWFIVHAASTETVRLPLVFTWRTYSTAVLIVLLSAGFSFFVVSRRVRRLNLLSVLKAAE